MKSLVARERINTIKNRQDKPLDLFNWLAAAACKRLLDAGRLEVRVRWRGVAAGGVAVANPADKSLRQNRNQSSGLGYRSLGAGRDSSA